MAFVDAETLRIGGLEVPMPRLEAGDWVDICWPGSPAGPEEKALFRFLSRVTKDSEVGRVTAFAGIAEHLFRRWMPWFRDVRLDVLRRRCARELLVEWDALASEYGCERGDHLSVLPGTPKVLLSVLLRMSESKLVMFSDAGLDPCGIDRVERLVGEARQRGWAFVRCLSEPSEGGVEVRFV